MLQFSNPPLCDDGRKNWLRWLKEEKSECNAMNSYSIRWIGIALFLALSVGRQFTQKTRAGFHEQLWNLIQELIEKTDTPTTHWTAGIKLNHNTDSYWGYIKTGFVLFFYIEHTFVNQKPGLDKYINIEIWSSLRIMFTHTHTHTHIHTHGNMLHHLSFICNMSVTVHSWGIYLGQGPLSHAQPHKCHVHANMHVGTVHTRTYTEPECRLQPSRPELAQISGWFSGEVGPSGAHKHTHKHTHTHTHTGTVGLSHSLALASR